MIYLRFEICELTPSEHDGDIRSVADFMFEANDPRECTRQAVDVLRKEGWKAVALRDAQEGFSPGDFVGAALVRSLYGAAESNGFAYELQETGAIAGGRS